MTCRPIALVALFAGLLLLGTPLDARAQHDPFSVDPTEAPNNVGPSFGGEPTGAPGAPIEEATAPAIANETTLAIDGLFLFACAALVFLMQAGFAVLEAGLNHSKHAVNILFKNVLNLAVGVLVFFVVGYHLMYPSDNPISEGVIGAISSGIDGGLLSSGTPGTAAGQVEFFFRAALAVTASTIVSGAVAGRMKFGAYVIYSVVVSAILFPTIGYWTWGLGWLHDKGFHDFAGSGVVHMTGGFAGLAGAILLGPRIGRYNADRKPMSMPGHSLPLATLGAFLLLIGWFGFTTGGQQAVYGADATRAVMLIAVNTLLAACAGGIVSTFLSWGLFSKPDLSMALNGLLGGLVGISASCNGVTNFEALAIGAVAGGIVVPAVILLDKLLIDDPVGAFPVHGVCGMWGLIACSLFGSREYWGGPSEGVAFGTLTAQLIGITAIGATSFFSMYALFGMLKSVGFFRVSADEEEKGLDVGEHGVSAYAA